MEVLSSRVLLRPADLARSRAFYEEVLGLRIAREYGAGGRVTGVVYFLGGGHLELVTGAQGPAGEGAVLWLQVADVDAEWARLAGRVDEVAEPETKPWGLREAWLADPDGNRIVLVEIPPEHPLRRRVD